MAEPAAPIEIPNRALFRAAEVCELLKLQPYVLRSWEAEFPELGVAKASGAPRLYRRGDVEQVLRIRDLLLVEGLTLAGARLRIDEEAAPSVSDDPALDDALGARVREGVLEVRRGLQGLLDLLGKESGAVEFQLAAPEVPGRSAKRSSSATGKPDGRAPEDAARSRRRGKDSA